MDGGSGPVLRGMEIVSQSPDRRVICVGFEGICENDITTHSKKTSCLFFLLLSFFPLRCVSLMTN